MRRIPLSVKNQSIETSGITKDYKEAICEYIWNGFEANAKNVELEWKHNQLAKGKSFSNNTTTKYNSSCSWELVLNPKGGNAYGCIASGTITSVA